MYFSSYSQGYTRTDLAFDRAYTYFTSSQNRASIPDFVICCTDGETNNGGQDRLADSVQNVKDLGVTVIKSSYTHILTISAFLSILRKI